VLIEETGAHTVITERSRQDLLDIGMATLLLAASHIERSREAVKGKEEESMFVACIE
jgi:hypothetical protein